MAARAHLPTFVAGNGIEPDVRTKVTRHGMEQVDRRTRSLWFAGKLPAVAELPEIAIEQTGEDPVGQDRLDRGKPDPDFPPAMGCGKDDRPGGDLRLEHRGHGLGLPARLV